MITTGKATQFAVTVVTAIESLLSRPSLRTPLRQRAKFEGWLKIELAAALAQDLGKTRVRLEYHYRTAQGTNHFADLWLDPESGQQVLIMLNSTTLPICINLCIFTNQRLI